MTLKETATLILKKCMALKKGETCLIVTDKNKLNIANALFDAAQEIAEKVEIMEIPVGKVNSEEQPEHVKETMKRFDVVLIPTTKSLSHTEARKQASEEGARIASMPGITEDMFLKASETDYGKITKVSNKLCDILDNGSNVKITTEKGTDIEMSIKDRKCLRVFGLLHNKGDFGNIPAGEACLAPVEGATNGVFIVDASFGGLGKVEDIKITVKDGYAVSIEGNEELKKMLKKAGKEAYNIAELGIGTNDKAVITGNILEDEKALGTAHIALGNNKSYGGNIDVPIHVDGIFYKPTIIVDDKKIMEKGKLLV